MKRHICITFAALALAGCEQSPVTSSTAPAQAACAPAWPIEEMLAEAQKDVRTNASVRMLMWRMKEDDRPLYVESCILHLSWRDNGKKWRLVHLYRHPRERNPHHQRWHVAAVLDVPYVGQQDYSHQPTAADMEQFLTDTWWHLGPRDGFKVLDAGINLAAWQSCFGTPPPDHLVKQLKNTKRKPEQTNALDKQ